MSAQNVIVVPVAGDVAHQSGQDRTEIASTIQDALEEKAHPKEEQPGPFKQMMANQESLYQYINWNDPVRTLGSYIGALSLLFGAHYLPLTQMVLKAGFTALGLVSVTESASRMLGNRSLSAQLRPREYKTFPESTLNATLKDIHDFAQYAAVQVQRIIFGQDLQKTFISFLGLTTLYWLTKAVSPFWLAVIALNTIYAAPLLASPRGREVIRDASTQAQDLATAASHKGRMAAHDASASAQRLGNAATETSHSVLNAARERADSLVGSTKETGRAAADSVTSSVQNLTGQGSEIAQKGKNTAVGVAKQARATASNASDSVTGGIASTGPNAGNTSSSSSSADAQVRGPQADRGTPRGTFNHESASEAHTPRQQHGNDLSQPSQATGAAVTDTKAHHPAVMYTTARDEKLEKSVLGRPRGAAGAV